MARRRRATKRTTLGDSRYGSPMVTRLINTVMRAGKKSIAETIVYTAIEKSREGSESVDPLDVLTKALDNVRPRLEVKSRRVGGATYQVPMEVPAERKAVPMKEALAIELKDAAAGQGNAIKKRDEMHKMAQANRAFAHFRW